MFTVNKTVLIQVCMVIVCMVLIGFFGFMLGKKYFYLPSSDLAVAVIDGDRLKKDAVPFHTVNALFSKEQNRVIEEMSVFENELSKEHEEIKSEKNSAKAKKRKAEFDIRVAELEQKMHKKRAHLLTIIDVMSKQLEDTVLAIIRELAAKRKINLVLNTIVAEKRSVFFNDDRLDLTDDVINLLNKRLANISLPKDDKQKNDK